MADGALTLHLDSDLSDRLRNAAAAAGADVGSYAARALDYAISDADTALIDEAIAEHTIRAGDGIPLDAVLHRLEKFGQAAG